MIQHCPSGAGLLRPRIFLFLPNEVLYMQILGSFLGALLGQFLAMLFFRFLNKKHSDEESVDSDND